MEDSKEVAKALIEEEDEVTDLSNVIFVVYWVITTEISNSCSVCVCIVLRSIT